ncbi:hypothetical protein DEJ33_05070 [Curtobacterium sp. MCPF17_047]|nr:hypothetical protein DEJ24_06345 [Curtobacterium sp. MCPF17_001]PZF67832.1 hypothetical protein DEJ33_05070 [Curtobacterium sp. MCPF17_047]
MARIRHRRTRSRWRRRWCHRGASPRRRSPSRSPCRWSDRRCTRRGRGRRRAPPPRRWPPLAPSPCVDPAPGGPDRGTRFGHVVLGVGLGMRRSATGRVIGPIGHRLFTRESGGTASTRR